jgi:uncharacterized C2H2 Zn-finger protein
MVMICPYCVKEFKKRKIIIKHVHTNSGPKKIEIHVCPYCEAVLEK